MDEKKKKGPGRPRKTPVPTPEPREGISKNPKCVQNIMEYSYDRPLVTKKVWGFFKSLFTDKLEIIFRKNEIIYFGNGHLKKNSVRISINTSKVNHYYLGQTLNIGVSCSDMGSIIAKVDRSYNNIMMISNKNHKQKNLIVTLQNSMEIDEKHTIGLIGSYDHMENEEEFLDEEDYPIRFTLSGKYFRKMINDIKGFSNKLIIKQDSVDDPLEFVYQKTNGNVKGINIVRNKKKIKFHSALKGSESFRVEVFIEYIKPLSSATLADEITIYAHETKPLLLVANVDAIEIRVLTEVVNERASA